VSPLLAWAETRHLWFLVLLPLIPLIAGVLRRATRRPLPSFIALLAAFAVYLGLFWFLFFGPFVELARPMTFPMTWRMGEPSESTTGQAHVVLTFRDYPGHIVGISSDAVASYFRGLGSETVDVTFEVTTTWGSTQGTRIIRIGGLTSGWVEEYGGSEVHSGGPPLGPSPFP